MEVCLTVHGVDSDKSVPTDQVRKIAAAVIEAADEVDRLSVDPEPETDTPQLSLTELRDEVRALTYHELSGIYDILGPACVRVVALFDAAHPRTT